MKSRLKKYLSVVVIAMTVTSVQAKQIKPCYCGGHETNDLYKSWPNWF